jgi:hypothetical protein
VLPRHYHGELQARVAAKLAGLRPDLRACTGRDKQVTERKGRGGSSPRPELTGRAAENRTGGELRRSTATWAGEEDGSHGEVPGGRVKLLRDSAGARAQGSGAPVAAELCSERRRAAARLGFAGGCAGGNGSRGRCRG